MCEGQIHVHPPVGRFSKLVRFRDLFRAKRTCCGSLRTRPFDLFVGAHPRWRQVIPDGCLKVDCLNQGQTCIEIRPPVAME